MATYYYSPTKQKILALLAAGVELGLSRSPKVQWRIMRNLPKVLQAIDRTTLRRIIHEFKYKRLVDFRFEKDGSMFVVLTEKGKRYALRYNPEKMILNKPPRWDGKRRIVMFDIPEKKRAAREAFRKYLVELGFYQLQRSVWVWPHDCKNEIKFLVELFEVRQYTQYAVVEEILHDAPLKLHFKLS